jgi:RecB family endonuclease NucS
MALYEVTSDNLIKIAQTTFDQAGLRERTDLQRLLQKQIDVILPDTLVIAEEFGEWEESKRRIDLLALDKNANLVVIELKSTEDGSHVELQAIRDAAMISKMKFERAVEIYEGHLTRENKLIEEIEGRVRL